MTNVIQELIKVCHHRGKKDCLLCAGNELCDFFIDAPCTIDIEKFKEAVKIFRRNKRGKRKNSPRKKRSLRTGVPCIFRNGSVHVIRH